MTPGADLRWGRRARAPQIHLLPPPQIQKLTDRSDVILEVPKCSKMQIFRGSAPDPDGGAYSASQTPYLTARGLAAPFPRTPIPTLGPSGLVFYRSQGLTHYRIGNPTSD